MKILSLDGADKLLAAVVRMAVDDYQAHTPGAYGSAKLFLRSCGLLHEGQLDTRLYTGHIRRAKGY